ncbi:MAG: hypothetical protein QOK40_142 [Miltoncostaeaceae bacterium]|nr:hypothetical protein [Miltoncostaeaceae bacterium]
MVEERGTGGAAGRRRPFAGATPASIADLTGVGIARRTPREVVFHVRPGEAFCTGAGTSMPEAILALAERARARRAGQPRMATIERRLPPGGWRRGVMVPPGIVREDHLFVMAWVGVAPVDGSHGDLGVLDPESVYASRDGATLPGATALRDQAAGMLEELAPLAESLALVDRVRHRIAQLADRCGVGTAAGIRLRLGLTHVQWPILVGASEEALTATFERLIARGQLIVEGRSLIIPWEAWPAYAGLSGGAGTTPTRTAVA